MSKPERDDGKPPPYEIDPIDDGADTRLLSAVFLGAAVSLVLLAAFWIVAYETGNLFVTDLTNALFGRFHAEVR